MKNAGIKLGEHVEEIEGKGNVCYKTADAVH